MLSDPYAIDAYAKLMAGEAQAKHISVLRQSLQADTQRTKKPPRYTKVMIRELLLRYVASDRRWHTTSLWCSISKHRNTPADILFQLFEPYTNGNHYLSLTGEQVLVGLYENSSAPPPIKMWMSSSGFAGMSFREYINGLGYIGHLEDEELKSVGVCLACEAFVVPPSADVFLYRSISDVFKRLSKRGT